MQDRYAGDVGDFGKFGMLRLIEKSGISVGINWYLVGDESHNNDGKHIGYLENKEYEGCDDLLLTALNDMIKLNCRSVAELEKCNLLSTQKYYHERLFDERKQWHKNALETMNGCDLVFLDPDNGLLPKSVSRGSEKSIKYVFPEEIIDYYIAGHSVVFYSHRTREKVGLYLQRFEKLFQSEELKSATIKGVSFKRGTIRDYFFIMREEHVAKIEESLATLFAGKWSRHFSEVQEPDCEKVNDEQAKEEKQVREYIRAKRKPGKTLVAGYINRNNQENLGCLNKPGNHFNQMAYLMRCNVCGHEYEANGCDVAIRKCPECG